MKRDEETLKEFSKIMWGVAEEFGGKISESGMQLKFETLKEYSIQEIQEAGVHILKYREENFPPVPTIKEFIETIASIKNMERIRLETNKLIGERNHEDS